MFNLAINVRIMGGKNYLMLCFRNVQYTSTVLTASIDQVTTGIYFFVMSS